MTKLDLNNFKTIFGFDDYLINPYGIVVRKGVEKPLSQHTNMMRYRMIQKYNKPINGFIWQYAEGELNNN